LNTSHLINRLPTPSFRWDVGIACWRRRSILTISLQRWCVGIIGWRWGRALIVPLRWLIGVDPCLRRSSSQPSADIIRTALTKEGESLFWAIDSLEDHSDGLLGLGGEHPALPVVTDGCFHGGQEPCANNENICLPSREKHSSFYV